MLKSIYRGGSVLALGLLWLISAAPVSAAEFPPELEPILSLRGDCGSDSIDPVPDPSCPYSAPPAGPTERFNEPRSIAIDAYGNEYVASYAFDGKKGRIDIFDDEGKFITEFSDPFGPKSLAVDTKGNLYAFEQGPESSKVVRYTPTVYKPETGEIAYNATRNVILSNSGIFEGGLAIDFTNDHLYVAQGNVIQEYSSAEAGNVLLENISPAGLAASTWVAVDGKRDRLFASSCREKGIFDCVIRVFDASAPYEQLDEVEAPVGKFTSSKGWLSIAVNEETGHFFVDDLEKSKDVYEYDENFEFVSQLTSGDFKGGNALQIAVSNSPLNNAARNREYLFIPVLSGAGNALAFEPPDVQAANIVADSVANISEFEAELRATIDPNGATTEYGFEYVTQQKFETEGFASAKQGGEGSIPGASQPTQVSVVIDGLSPGTAYRFRVTAQNEVGKDEAEGTFSTYSDAEPTPQCANQALLIGPSALLPDCRAYELVTPPDTNGRPPKGVGFEGDRFATVESSPLGSTVSFMLEGGALPGTDGTGGFHGDKYRTTRGTSSWTTAALPPSGAESTQPQPGSTSPDQGFQFWRAAGEGSAVVDEQETHYVRYPDGNSELVGRGSLGTDPSARGKMITENGTHIIFQTETSGSGLGMQLEPNAPPTGTRAVYDRTSDEVTHVVSLMPGNETPAAGKDAFYLAASADGAGIAFEIGNTLYVRVDNTTTYEIGENVNLAGISEGGGRVFYVEGGDLLALDTETEEVIPFSESGDITVVNVAPQGTRAYFISPGVLTGEANPNGDIAEVGEQNLYLSEEGQVSFVATVTDRDVEGELNGTGTRFDGLGRWVEATALQQPGTNTSRLTPSGSVLLFQSRANLDDYDSGEFAQIYRFDSATDQLRCISCIPTRTPATGGASFQSFAFTDLVSPFGPYGFVPALRADGDRAFFESTEALVSTDTDEARDVYEWEEQEVGSCGRSGGCVYLVSSGHSARNDYLYGHSASGDDVFFTTGDVLTGTDGGGTFSIYDAKVGGGFPETVLNPCQDADSCRGQGSSGPSFPTPTSEGLGRTAEPKQGHKCPKGKRKVKQNGKVRCVKKKHHKGKKQSQAGTNKKGGSK